MISYCTTCHNRLWQLKQTLPFNLKKITNTDSEICLVDYGSTDGLSDWIFNNFSEEIETGKLIFFQTQAKNFNASHAKNIAHLLASRPILFNLDADNFIGDSEQIIKKLYEKNPHTIIQNWSGSLEDGTYGRIIISRKNFFRLGGYDEALKALSFQDTDLIIRARNMDLSYLLLPYAEQKLPIKNTNQQKSQHLDDELKIHQLKNEIIHKRSKWLGVRQGNQENRFGHARGKLNFKSTHTTGFRVNELVFLNFSKIIPNIMEDLERSLFRSFIEKVFLSLFIYKFISFFRYQIFYRSYSIFMHKFVYRVRRIYLRFRQ